jgi:uncharacterized membrane protein
MTGGAEVLPSPIERGLQLAVPFIGRPSSPVETVAMLDSFGASLMPRSSMHQGVATGMSILAARATSVAVESMTRRLIGASDDLTVQLLARAMVGAVGYAASRIPEKDNEPTPVATARAVGELTVIGSLGGVVHDVGRALEQRYPAQRALRPLVLATMFGAGVAASAQRRLRARNAAIEPWTAADKPSSLGGSIGVAAGVVAVGSGLAGAYGATRRASVRFYGPMWRHQIVARGVHAGLWGGALTAAYRYGVQRIARANEKVEPAYSEVPTSPLVSGTEDSYSKFADLGMQGRRYVTDVVDRRLIETTMGEPALAEPVRVYIGYDSEPTYREGRAELALAELERTGAFDRSYLLLISPTGTGWVDQTLIESAELLALGDIATCAVQYGTMPSFLAVQKVRLGRRQFRALLYGVRARLAAIPEERRPKLLIFGESLGAWTSSDVVMHNGTSGLDWYGVHRALWVGLPGLAKWSKTGMRSGQSALVEPGTVRAFDNAEELDALSDAELDALRVVILDHDNDPITVMNPRLGVKRPDWLRSEQRGRNVPEALGWVPVITLVQTVVDAMNAMRVVPGEFKSFGHDYRGDMARFVHRAFGFAADEAQVLAVDGALRTLELERGRRIAASAGGGADDEAPGDHQ